MARIPKLRRLPARRDSDDNDDGNGDADDDGTTILEDELVVDRGADEADLGTMMRDDKGRDF
jgi:hypothetical protein